MRTPANPTQRCDVDAAFRQICRAERALLRALGRSAEDLDLAFRLAERGIVLLLGEVSMPTLREKVAGSPRSAFLQASRLRQRREALLELCRQAHSKEVRQRAEEALVRRDRVVELNQGLIAKQVKRAVSTKEGKNEDLCAEARQQASLSMLGAVDRFQPRRGVAFSTFVMRSLDGAIREARNAFNKNIHIPDDVRGMQAAYLRTEAAMRATLHREPTQWEVAEAMGQPLESVDRMEQILWAEERLDGPAPDEPGEFVTRERPDEGARTAQETAEAGEMGSWLRRAFDGLSRLQEQVLMARFGFLGGVEQTRPEVARGLNLTQAQVARLEREALAGIQRGLGPCRGEAIRRQFGVAACA